MTSYTERDIILIDTYGALLRLLPRAGAATVTAVNAEIRRCNSGWRDDEILEVLRLLEAQFVIASRSDHEGTLSIIVPGAAWPSGVEQEGNEQR